MPFPRRYRSRARMSDQCAIDCPAVPYETLTLAVADRIATLTLNRPEKLNALNDAMIAELGVAIAEIRSRDDVGGAVVTGAGRAFVAGADIGELASQSPGAGSGACRPRTRRASAHRDVPQACRGRRQRFRARWWVRAGNGVPRARR